MRYPGGSGGETGETVTYTYHPQQALNSVTSDLGAQYVQSTSYDAAGRADMRALSGGAFHVDLGYFGWTVANGQGRLQQIRSGLPATPDSLQDLRYTYDAVGNVSTISDYRAGPPQTQTFGYDTLERLTSASVASGTGGLYSETYTYTSTSGNLDTKGGVQYAYNDPAHVHGVTHLGGVERYRYDAVGNQTWRSSDGNTHDLLYDAESRLIEVRQGGTVIAEFLYDGNGELVREISGGQTTVYVGRHQEVVLGSTPSPSATPTITPTSPTATVSPTPTATPAGGAGLTGEYFHNADLTSLALVRTDPTVNFNWGSGSPAGNIAGETFSARWTGYVEPQYSATYTFHVRHDDGARLWVNGQQIINRWVLCGGCDSSGTIALTAGVKYPIRLEFYENTGGALVDLGWSNIYLPRQIIPQGQLFTADATPTPTVTPTRTPAPTSTATRTPTPTSTNVTSGTGLTGDYFNNADFTDWKLTRTDATVNFAWGTGSPNASIGADTFSVRWTGYVQPAYSQTYIFYVNHDDGARLWVNNTLLIDQWATTGEHSGIISLSAGVKYSVRLEYFENTGSATAQLSWSSASQAKQIIPQTRLYPAAPTATPPPTATPAPTFTPSPTATPFTGIGISSIVTTYSGPSGVAFNHTVEPGPNRVLVVTKVYTPGFGPYTSTFDGQPITTVNARCDQGADTVCAVMGYLVNPPVGTYPVLLSSASGGYIIAGVMTLYGVDQSSPISSTATAYGTGASASITLGTQPGELALDILAEYCTSALTPGPGQTERWDVAQPHSTWGIRGATSSEPANGTSVTMSYSWGGPCDHGYVAVAFRSAANATPTPTPSPSPTPTSTPTAVVAPSGQIWRSYYFAGSQRIAMRVQGDPLPANNGVFYLLGDHLGSTNVVVDADGALVSELRYKAWGETRYSAGATPMDYRYTGQREEAGLGLYYYRARWYDPGLGRFVQADTIRAGTGPNSWDRYAYVSSNPLRYADPSGHVCSDPEDPTPSCSSGQPYPVPQGPPPDPPSPPGPDPDDSGGSGPGGSGGGTQIELEDWEVALLAMTVFAETSNGTYPFLWQRAIAWVMLNRLSSGRWRRPWDAWGYGQTALHVLYDGIVDFSQGDDETTTREWVTATWNLRLQGPTFGAGYRTAHAAAVLAYTNWRSSGPGSASDPTVAATRFMAYDSGGASSQLMRFESLVGQNPELTFVMMGPELLEGIGPTYLFFSSWDFAFR